MIPFIVKVQCLIPYVFFLRQSYVDTHLINLDTSCTDSHERTRDMKKLKIGDNAIFTLDINKL